VFLSQLTARCKSKSEPSFHYAVWQFRMPVQMASGTNANANCNGKCFGERVFHGGYWVKAAGAAPLTQKLFNI